MKKGQASSTLVPPPVFLHSPPRGFVPDARTRRLKTLFNLSEYNMVLNFTANHRIITSRKRRPPPTLTARAIFPGALKAEQPSTQTKISFPPPFVSFCFFSSLPKIVFFSDAFAAGLRDRWIDSKECAEHPVCVFC